MSDFEFELDGMPAEPPAPEPAAPAPGPAAPTPSEVTQRFIEQARQIEAGTPPAAPPQPPEQPAAPEPVDERQAEINRWVDAQIDQRVQQQVAEAVDQQLAELLEVYPPEVVAELIAELPPEVQRQIAERHGQLVEQLEYQELLSSEAMQERAQQAVDEGVAELRSLVDSWNAEQVGAPPIDVARVYELALERWPQAQAQVGDSQEVAQGLLREAFDELAAEAYGERVVFQQIENEAAKLGVELDVVKTKAVADQLWPSIAREFGGDEQEAARQAVSAAVQLMTNFRPATDSKRITTFYAKQAQAIRRAEGQVDGAPPAHPGELSLPSLTTRKFAAQAAAIRARGGLP